MRIPSWWQAMALVMSSQTFDATAADASCSARSGAQVMPMIELYTSEGCSSCPPADRWLSRNLQNFEANALAFHVDYWDRLGWPDRFASAQHSQRQRQRVNAAGERSVYTPQVMLGAQVQAPWRDDAQFRQPLARQRQPATVEMQLHIEPIGSDRRVRVDVTPTATAEGESSVWLARYVDDQSTVVRAGESGGVTLHHDRVVHRLWGPWPLRASPLSKAIEMPPDPEQGGFMLFAQTARGQVLQSLNLPDASCR
jgi:hypothetical protein